MTKNILVFFSFLFLSVAALAQELETWNVYPSFSTVSSISISENSIYAATLGGVFSVEGGEIGEQITTMEGLYRSNPTHVIFDDAHQQILAGYIDGTIDVIDIETGQIDRIEDIQRVTRFNSKSINGFKIFEGRLYVATSFGIVVFNLENLLVEDSFLKLGTFNIGTQINDIDIVSDSIYAATTQGIAVGDLAANLVQSDHWQNYTEEHGLPVNLIDEVKIFKDNIYALVEGSIYTQENESWNLNADFPESGNQVLERNINSQTLATATNTRITILDEQGNTETRNLPLESTITELMLLDDAIYFGTSNEGLGILEDFNAEPKLYLPSGPYLNFFNEILASDSNLIATSTQEFPSSNPLNTIRGYYIYSGDEWNNFNVNTNPTIDQNRFVMAYSLGENDFSYFFGSWGSGLVKHSKDTNEITYYDRSNSSLLGIDDSPGFVVISDLDSDAQNNMWAISYRSDFPLYVQMNGTEEWIPFRGLSGNDHYYKLFVDTFDQKWIALRDQTNTGLGLLIIKTGDPQDPNDDEAVKLTSSNTNGNLPDEKVNAIIEDKNGEVWIGTGRGIARFIFPELVVEGGPEERQAQWLINEDTTAVSRFLLRDVNVTAMAVNDANQKWIGSMNQGLWLLNEEGSRIEKRFTAENSNLISDNILSITINNETGQVFVATDLGLVSFQDIPKAPVRKMGKLKVFPNPFQYSKHNQIVIEGLSEATSIKIIGVDGMVVNELEARGGRISWDGYDFYGNELGTGVYFVVAYENSGRETGIGKIVLVR